jgi:uncharacterized lipoprotein YmbA
MTKTRLALLALAFGTGCLSSQPERFYALSDQRAAAAPVARFPGTVLIAPVLIPDLIDRPQLVVRGADGRLDVLEHQRWAEALDAGIGGLMAKQLSRRLVDADVSSTEDIIGKPDLRVAVDIRAFELRADQGITVEALWTVTGAGGVVRRGKTRAVQPASGGGYDALTLAASLAVDAVSADVARAILALGTERPVAGGGPSPAARIR